jgi:rare lipoprotein A
MRHGCWALVFGALLLVAGCSHRAQMAASSPPPPVISENTNSPNAHEQPDTPPSEQSLQENQESSTVSRPIYSEVGMASWYGPPYNKRHSANGEIYDEDAVTAAHRTLPMGSLIRVTNLETGQSAMMHITDRGPFVPDRVIDLSKGAAKLLGVWRLGTARVRIDVIETPEPIYQGGFWCVQIGAFAREDVAKDLKAHLAREYESAHVIEFAGPTGHWVRIRPENGDKSRAIEIVRNIRLTEGAAYLVRLN